MLHAKSIRKETILHLKKICHEEPSPQTDNSKESIAARKNESILRAFFQKVWNEKDFDSIVNYVAPYYTIHIDSSDPWEGKTLNYLEFAMRLDYTFDSFPDMYFEIQTLIADGNYVAITWIMTGTNTGEIAGFSPTNKTIKANGFTIYHFNGSQICGHTQVCNKSTIMKQLGFHHNL